MDFFLVVRFLADFLREGDFLVDLFLDDLFLADFFLFDLLAVLVLAAFTLEGFTEPETRSSG